MSVPVDSTPNHHTQPHGVEASPHDTFINTFTSRLDDNRDISQISPDELRALLARLQQQQQTIDALLQQQQLPSTAPSVNYQAKSFMTKTPDYYNIAKYEDIVCKGIKPSYDGSPDNLIPFLNRLDIRRQDESWYPTTIVIINGKSFDLTRHFVQVSEDDILKAAQQRWTSPSIATDKLTLDHPTFNARVLGRLLMASITDTFSITIINRIPQDLHNDGPLILWTVCNHIHRNNIAFVETIKTKIRNATLTQFSDDVDSYIIYIKDNLRLISAATDDTKEHNDLITYIFAQLSMSNINLFQDAVQKWQIEYLEANMPDLMPTKLLKLADDKAQVLKHAGQWKTIESPAVMALKLELEQQRTNSQTLVKNIVAHVGQLLQKQRNKSGNGGNAYQYPEWMTEPPPAGILAKMHDNKQYNWCHKCRQGKGLWVLRHTSTTHVEGFRRQPKRFMPQDQNRDANRTRQDTPQQKPSIYLGDISGDIPAEPHAQLSLNDYLNSYFDDAPTEMNP
jgi:hypothetical protein